MPRKPPAYLGITDKPFAGVQAFVAYIRVSSTKQETESESLNNQERAVKRHVDRSGNVCLRIYREAASGKNETNRPEFQRMLRELPTLAPRYILVDKIDRFTRNAVDGISRVQELRDSGVGLVSLDWLNGEPINPENERDWRELFYLLGSAQGERMRLSGRIKNSYQNKYERGLCVSPKARFGCILKKGVVTEHPEQGPIVRAMDQRFLGGESIAGVLRFVRAAHPLAWKTKPGVRAALSFGDQYIRAGIRSPETQGKIDTILKRHRDRRERITRHEHELTGVFLCGRCAEIGKKSRLTGITMPGRNRLLLERLACNALNDKHERAHLPRFTINASRVESAWRRYLDLISDESLLVQWAATKDSPGIDVRRPLERRLHEYDMRDMASREKRENAIHLYGQMKSLGSTAYKQAEASLMQVAQEEAATAAERQATLYEIAHLPAAVNRDVDALRDALSQIRRLYEQLTARDRNRLNWQICEYIGSRPVVYRAGSWGAGRRAAVTVVWPEIDALVDAAPKVRRVKRSRV